MWGCTGVHGGARGAQGARGCAVGAAVPGYQMTTSFHQNNYDLINFYMLCTQ